jgi:superfamily II DNA or RNA helicase
MRSVKLPNETVLRDYQDTAVDYVADLIESNETTWNLFSAPTGTGKSVIELKTLERKPGGILITPRLEIISGMMEKLGHYVEDMSDTELVASSWEYGIITPIRLRNLLAAGNVRQFPRYLIVDESHHDAAETYQDIAMYLNGILKIGLTATPYRGTPKGTAELLSQWGNKVNEIISLRDAVESGYCVMPTPVIWPMLDDDLISVTGGEFKVSTTTAMVSDTLVALVDRIKPFYSAREHLYDKPTMIAVPSTDAVNQLMAVLRGAGLPAMSVTQATSRHDRSVAFRSTVHGSHLLVQIDVVSEGVDLPIRRLIDVKPTMSPVRWVQQIGRIMRPCTDASQYPEYVCCCRNLERHCYLMEGLFPPQIVIEAQTAFTTPSKRTGSRAVGLEGLGKFTTTPVHCLNGATAFMYNLVNVDGFQRTEYCVLVHPLYSETVQAKRVSVNDGNGNMKWGKWSLIESMPPLEKGFNSAPAKTLTEKQRAWWLKDCQRKGLDPNRELTSRGFQILPFLMDTGLVLS